MIIRVFRNDEPNVDQAIAEFDKDEKLIVVHGDTNFANNLRESVGITLEDFIQRFIGSAFVRNWKVISE